LCIGDTHGIVLESKITSNAVVTSRTFYMDKADMYSLHIKQMRR